MWRQWPFLLRKKLNSIREFKELYDAYSTHCCILLSTVLAMSEDRRRGSSGVSRVGKYMLLETLGEGAFGKVKLAVDERDGQQYAVKIMRKQDIQQQELTLQVRREIAVMKALRHRKF